MKKIYLLKIISFIILLFGFASCEKPLIETGVVEGIVKDATTHEPIVNADVFLLQNEKGDGSIIGGGGPSKQIDYTTSDANGNFTFHFNYNKNYSYLCGAEKELYFDLNQEFAVDAESKGGVNVEVLLNPVAWLSVHVKAVNEYEPSDYIGINSLQNDPYYGSTVDTIETITVYGNITFQMTWFLFEIGTEIFSQTEYIYCPAFDTTYFEIFY